MRRTEVLLATSVSAAIRATKAGDDVLCKVAAQLRRACRTEDTVARIGGDEFVVVVEVADMDEVDLLRSRLHEVVREPVTLAAGELRVDASIGVATACDPEPPETLLARADAAMHARKRGR